jgi:hypothetical protein
VEHDGPRSAKLGRFALWGLAYLVAIGSIVFLGVVAVVILVLWIVGWRFPTT